MVLKYYCWGCKRQLHANQVKVTKEEYICKVCGSSAVNELEMVSKAIQLP